MREVKMVTAILWFLRERLNDPRRYVTTRSLLAVIQKKVRGDAFARRARVAV